MAEENSSPQIIVVKKRRGHGKHHHGGAWKVAYADFVTAMMALFIVLWLLSSSEEVQKAVGGYFQDPLGNGKLQGSTHSGTGEGILAKKEDMDELKEKLLNALQVIPQFQKMKDQVQLNVTGDGLRVELLETEKGLFFEKGSPAPSEQGRELLLRLSEELSKLPNSILIEGHTDAIPYSGKGEYSNWELSSDRANAARRLMQAAGLRQNQVIQVRGFADQSLRDPGNPTNPANRRISVVIRYQTPPAQTPPAENGAQAGGKKSSGKTGVVALVARPPASQPASPETVQ
ncbi:MAG: flagellar motor protein MotB [Bryobacteraceae bacterium]